ncbi:MAG: hypothetical protein ACYCY1_15655 [Sulfuriferula sp.]
MSEHLQSQGLTLVNGVNAFEPYIRRLHSDYKDEKFLDWPTIVLLNTLQATAISIFRLLPPAEYTKEILDKRSIASLIRNVVDTHDVLRMMGTAESEDHFNLHRNILGLYLSSRTNQVQNAIDPKNTQSFFAHTKKWYWERIRKSPIYKKEMDRLKNGESLFYESRRSRVESVCGEHGDFVIGVLADLSTYVHSVPPPIWFSSLNEMYSDNKSNRDVIAVWLRIANFYMAKGYETGLSAAKYEKSAELSEFLDHHHKVFS